MARRRWRSVRLNGAGRSRIKIAEMLESQLGIKVDSNDIHCNSTPTDKWLDMCRWCVDGKDSDGRHVHVCSWDRMGDIIRSNKIAVVDSDPHAFEICCG